MKDAQLNSAAFLDSPALVLSWYQQHVDNRAKGARLEIGPDGTPTGRMIITHDCELADQAVHLEFVQACLTFENWRLSSRKKWTTTPKGHPRSIYEVIQTEENAAREEHRNPSMRHVLSIIRRQKPRLSDDKILLLFDEVFGAYLQPLGHRTDWRW